MAEERESAHGFWSSRWAFIMAAAGSAVGLGNVWKFPYITGENGGGAFVLVYLVCILLIGIPVMMGEILIGRRGRRNPAGSMAVLAEEAGRTPLWQLMGYAGILSSFLLLSFYIVIAGWSFAYVLFTVSGAFHEASPDAVGARFESFLSNWQALLTWGTLVMALCILTITGGVRKGIERAVTTLMPGMLLILLILVGYALNTGSFQDALNFLFAPDFSALSGRAVLVALGHAFFTLSLASGVMMAYGAYLPRGESIARTVLWVAGADTVIALLAGLAIFPIVFEYSLDAAEGPGLIFVTLPIAFGQMPYGTLFGTLFFVMLSLAAFTSAISLLEPSVAMLMERFGTTRMKATLAGGLTIWVVSLGTVFSFNLAADWTLFGKTFFDNLDYLTANILMPLGGLLIAIFVGRIMKADDVLDELGEGDGRVFRTWFFVLRWVAPIAIIVVFLNVIGVLQFGVG